MRTMTRMARGFVRHSAAIARGFYAMALCAVPAWMALAPAQAAAQETYRAAPLGLAEAQSPLFDGYFALSSSGGSWLQGLLTHTAARDILIAAMFAICIAMIFAASYLWRENVAHLQADVEKKQRDKLDMF